MAKKKKDATKRLLVLIGALLVLIIISTVIVSATGALGSRERAVEVEIETVEIRSVTQIVTASGIMQPECEV